MKGGINRGISADIRSENYVRLIQLLGVGLATVQGKKEEKFQPLPRRKLSRNARRLLNRILTATSEDNPVWAEGTNEVAKALKVDRSTVVRIVKRLRGSGVLQPLDLTGGRGRVSQYAVDRGKARALLRQGYWELAEEAEPEKAMHKDESRWADLQDQVQRDPNAPLGVTAVKVNLQPLSASEASLTIFRDLSEWITDKARSAVETLKDTFENPAIWNLLGHAGLFAGTCLLGGFGIYKLWQTKGKGPALALSIPVGLGVYFSWQLLVQELTGFLAQDSVANSRPQATHRGQQAKPRQVLS